jgi:hypothetical protein
MGRSESDCIWQFVQYNTQTYSHWHNNNNKLFSAPRSRHYLWTTHTAFYTSTTATVGSLPVCKADHSPSSPTEVKNGGAIPPPPISLHGMAFNYLNTGTKLSLPKTGFWGCNITVSTGIKSGAPNNMATLAGAVRYFKTWRTFHCCENKLPCMPT